jgi:ORF6N domain-containing protein
MPSSVRVDVDRIQRLVVRARSHNVMIDEDLAPLYGVPVKALNQAVSRNKARFPPDFMFRLTPKEAESLRSQRVTAKTTTGGRGGRRNAPYAFTEQGVAMLSSVLRSPRAVRTNIEIMRAFVQLRRMMAPHAELVRKLDALERKYDGRFEVVFEALRGLTKARSLSVRRIGFRPAQKRLSSAVGP